MTREEAIKHLSEWMDEKMWRCFGTIDREAIGMAIEALKADVTKKKAELKDNGDWDCPDVYCDECDHHRSVEWCSLAIPNHEEIDDTYKMVNEAFFEGFDAAEKRYRFLIETVEELMESADAEQVTGKLKSVEISTDKGDESTMSQPNGKLDLISRADVLKYPIRLDHYDEVNGSREFVYGVESVMEYVESLPSADRPTGEWIVHDYEMKLICPICGETFNFDEVDELLDYKEYAKFCLACGADMRG